MNKPIKVIQGAWDLGLGTSTSLIGADEADTHSRRQGVISQSSKARPAPAFEIEEVEAAGDEEVFRLRSAAVVDPHPVVEDVSAEEVSAVVHDVGSGAEARQERAVPLHPRRLSIDADRRVLSRLPQIREVEEHERMQFALAIARGELEPEESGVLARCHGCLDPGLQLDSEIARPRDDRVGQVRSRAVADAEIAVVDLVVRAQLREEREVPETGVPAGPRVVHGGEADDVGPVGRKAACVLAVDVGDGLSQPVRPRRTCEDIPSVRATDEGVNEAKDAVIGGAQRSERGDCDEEKKADGCPWARIPRCREQGPHHRTAFWGCVYSQLNRALKMMA